MGAESSGTVARAIPSGQKIATTIISQTDIDVLNSYLTNIATNIVVNNTATCDAGLQATNSFVLNGVKVAGTAYLSVNQSIDATVENKCVNIQNASSTISQSLVNNILEEITTKFSPETISTMTGTAFTPQDTDTTVSNSVYEDISNIVETNVTNNFSSSTISSCLTSVNALNQAEFTGVDFGSFLYLPVNQSINASVTSECSALQTTISDITTNIAQELGLTISDTVDPIIQTTENGIVTTPPGTQGPDDSVSGDTVSGDTVSDDTGLTTGAIAGIIIGVILFIALIVGAVYLVKYLKNKAV